MTNREYNAHLRAINKKYNANILAINKKFDADLRGLKAVLNKLADRLGKVHPFPEVD